jgi:CubicO group peptidase (beta-lactamase class C family)
MRLSLALLPFLLVVSSWAHPEIKPEAMENLVRIAAENHSDALVVWQDGRLHTEVYFGLEPHKVEAMSVTKSVVNLAIGRLITTGKLTSIDTPVSDFYPEWKQGRKAAITVRHLLSHTSGLQTESPTSKEIYPAPDFVQLALAAELAADPGSAFLYNNKAVNLLAGIVAEADGRPLDDFLSQELFSPMGITDFTWSKDPKGNPHAMSGLQILPGDLAKLGQLVLDRGRWNGNVLISADWFAESLQPAQSFMPNSGLLWWLVPERMSFVIDEGHIKEFLAKGVQQDFVDKARHLVGRYDSAEAYIAALEKGLGTDWRRQQAEILAPLDLRMSDKEMHGIQAYEANGDGGQFLVIVPSSRVVAVRMVDVHGRGLEAAESGFPNFTDLVLQLTR